MDYEDFLDNENRLRVGPLHKAEGLESHIREVNRALAPLEAKLEPGEDPVPTIFVFGLPRSGTTLCQQLISYCLDVGYVNNLIARFWRAPVHGIALSRLVLGDRRDGAYESMYGKTHEPWGVHEFSYFWHDVLNIRSAAELESFGGSDRVNWPEARRRVALIAGAFERTTAFKTDYAGEYLKDFLDWMPQPVFVYVRRDLRDSALSLLRARVDYYRDPNTWWSMYPPDYQELRNQDFAHQIAGQVVGLDRAYQKAVMEIDNAALIEVEYTHLVADPGALLGQVVDRVGGLYGARVAVVNEPPRFTYRSYDGDLSQQQRAVVSALVERTRQ